MNILIHACLKRNWYVYKHLIPSLLAQGIKEDEIHVWMDIARDGNLKSFLNSCHACGIRPGGTWHLQDDVIISRRFAEMARECDDGLVCGFCNEDFGPFISTVGMQPSIFMWNSFQCIRIPNRLAEEFYIWFYNHAVNKPEYRDKIRENKYDDWFWQQFINEKHGEDLKVFNMKPNIVDHIDYLIGGSSINSGRTKPMYRAAYWEDEDLVEALKQNI